MLTYRRPAFSDTEEAFIDRYIVPLGAREDGYGNLWVEVGENNRVLWSSHTDTVHRKAGMQLVSAADGVAQVCRPSTGGRKKRKGDSNCLGADCTTGVWLMREMILAAVPGVYVFHRAEEIGGLGSQWIASNRADWLAGIDFAIAFDRKGTRSVITHQGKRTASDAFARSVCDILKDVGLSFEADDSGLFTDTANYTDLVGECSNLSVGYYGQHGPAEEQDLEFAVALRDAVVAADWTRLVASRQPGERDSDFGFGHSKRWWDDDDTWHRYAPSDRADYAPDRGYGSLYRFCKDEPEVVADFLEANGFTRADLEAWADQNI
jgi:hypothetical protein